MAKLFIILLVATILLGSFAASSMATGFADFVAVADRSSCAVTNPAGLVNLQASDFNWEHRFTDRDKGNMDSDDLIVYTAPGTPGYGAIFYAYSQDLVDAALPGLYWRTTSYGYAYGWSVTDNVNVGLAIKGVNLSSYDTVAMMQQTFDAGVVFDFGMQMRVDERMKLGLAVHNIGRDIDNSHLNYETAVGVSYQIDKLTAAVEINDYLNESGNPDYKLGCRYKVSESIQPWAFLLVTNDGYFGGALGLEYQNEAHLKVDISWFLSSNATSNISSIKTTVGYRF